MLDTATMSDGDESKVALSSESWDRSTARLISDSGLPARLRRDQALAQRVQPRGQRFALEGHAARRPVRPLAGDDGHGELMGETKTSYPRYAQRLPDTD